MHKSGRKPLRQQLRFSEQRQAEVHAEIRAVMTAFRQLARQFSISAAQVQDGFIPFQALEHASDPRLEAILRELEGYLPAAKPGPDHLGFAVPLRLRCADGELHLVTTLTSFATALSLVGLLIFGVGTIFDFAMAMLIGIVSGTYSTWFIAAPMTIWLEERAEAKRRSASARAA